MESDEKVDWDVVDDELYHIPAVYKDPRFDSLKHVLTVLGAVDSEAALEELREQHETVDGLVDDVVSAYHNGFNKAIHNYSQILQLFGEAKAQVESTKESLADAKQRLGTTSRNLQQQWKRSVMLDDICTLLADVQTLVDIPPRIQKLEEAEDWTAAATLLLDGCNRLARQEMAKVGALRDLKKDMGVRRNVLLKAIVEELERRIYHSAIGESSESSEAEDETPELSETLLMEEVPALPGANEASPARSRQSAVLDTRRSMLLKSRRSQMLDSRKSGLLGKSQKQTRHSSVHDLRRSASANASRQGRQSATMQRAQSAGARKSGIKSLPAGGTGSSPILARMSSLHLGRAPGSGERRTSLVIGRNRPASAAAVMTATPFADAAANGGSSMALPSLVEALVQIGGVAETQASLRRHMSSQMHGVIARALEAAEPAVQSEESSQAAGTEALTLAAQASLQRVFEECIQVMANMAAVMRLLAAAKPAPASAGLDLLLEQRKEQGIRYAEQMLSRQQAQQEADYAWECMQTEMQRLLAELLSSASLSSSNPASGSSIGWQPGRNGIMAPRDAGKLTFSFDADSTTGSFATSALPQSDRPLDSQDLGAMLMRVLGGQSGNMHLTPIIYRPVVSFTDAVSRMLEDMLEEDDSEQDGGREAAPADRRQLRAFADAFVAEDFLPDVFVDFRGRCTKLLEDPEAFHPRARLRGPAAGDSDAAGRPLLPAAIAADRMLSSLLLWAAQLPPFVTHLIGIVESVLAKVLDAFQTRMAVAMAGTAVQNLAQNPALARLMAAEPAASQAGDPVAFFAGRQGDSIDAFVTDIISAGFAGGGEAAEAEVLSRLLQERNVAPEQLLSVSGEGQRLVALAALSDSLDFLADAIVRFGNRRHADNGNQAGYMGRGRAGEQGQGLTEGLAHLLDRFRAASGMAVRALRLELTLLLVVHLQDLAKVSYAREEEDSQEVDECIGAFSRAVARAEEDLGAFLPPSKRSYVFGSLAAQAARYIMWLLPELKVINAAGVARMNRQLSVLQPALAAAGAAGGQFRPEAVRVFERARTYYTLLTYSADSLVKVAADRPGRFTPSEYLALLQVSVPDRYVSNEHRSQLQRIVAPGVPRQSAAYNALKAMRVS